MRRKDFFGNMTPCMLALPVTLLFIAQVLTLKGKCHEMVVEVRPWSGRLALK
jgi:hypothetical protein